MIPIYSTCSAVLVFDEKSKVLLLNRIDGQGWSLPGGKAESYDCGYPRRCARREVKEETSLSVRELYYLGTVLSVVKKNNVPTIVCPIIYIADSWSGSPKFCDKEFVDMKWFDLEEAILLDDLFPPTRQALLTYYKHLDSMFSDRTYRDRAIANFKRQKEEFKLKTGAEAQY